MGKAPFVALMICMSFTGCILEDDDDDDNSPSLRESVNDFISSLNTQNWSKWCSYFLDYQANFMNHTEMKEYIDEMESDYAYMEDSGLIGIKTTIDNYDAERLDYKASEDSGYVYSVSMSVEQCFTFSTENNSTTDTEEDCEYFDEEGMLWAKVDRKWGWGETGFEGYHEGAPIATFFVQEDSNGVYHVDVIKVSKQEELAKFSYWLKDEDGEAYLGGNGFGEIAMQNITGELKGIDQTYSGDEADLQARAEAVDADDGSEYPVHFADNDRDGKLSAGDRFHVYGTGNAANGPASDNWRLEIQYDPTVDIIGSAKLL